MVFIWRFDETPVTPQQSEQGTVSLYRMHLEASVLNLPPLAETLTLQRERTEGI